MTPDFRSRNVETAFPSALFVVLRAAARRRSATAAFLLRAGPCNPREASSAAADGGRMAGAAPARLLLGRAAQVVTVAGAGSAARHGGQMGQLGLRENCSVVVGSDGTVKAVSCRPVSELVTEFRPMEVRDCAGKVVSPGFVDPHSHVVFAGDRSGEMADKLAGATYDEVHKRGGGINFTVRATKRASTEHLTQLALKRLERMAAAGTTHVEIKSGYGLDWPTELKVVCRKQLQVETHNSRACSSCHRCGAASLIRSLCFMHLRRCYE